MFQKIIIISGFCFVIIGRVYACPVIGSGPPKMSEPEYCQLLQPSASDRLALSAWMLGSGDALKRQGCWKSHIYWGELAIQEILGSDNIERQQLLVLKLASSYFYLGDYDSFQKVVLYAETLIVPEKHWKAQVEILYLSSALARVRKQKDAVFLVEQALLVLDKQTENTDFLRAKVLYNLGGALTDGVDTDYGRAVKVLKQAEHLFRKMGDQYDLNRAVIRVARVLYLQGHYSRALAELNTIHGQLESPRGRMLYFQQRAKVLMAMKNWKEADRDAKRGFDLALVLSAEKDQKRIREIQAEIRARKQSLTRQK